MYVILHFWMGKVIFFYHVINFIAIVKAVKLTINIVNVHELDQRIFQKVSTKTELKR